MRNVRSGKFTCALAFSVLGARVFLRPTWQPKWPPHPISPVSSAFSISMFGIYWGIPKIRDIFSSVPRKMIIVFGGLCWVPIILRNYPINPKA